MNMLFLHMRGYRIIYFHLFFVYCIFSCGADGLFLVEVDRLLRPGGYFVWTDPLINSHSLRNKANLKKWNTIYSYTENLCWEMLPQQDQTVVWKKTSKKNCYSGR